MSRLTESEIRAGLEVEAKASKGPWLVDDINVRTSERNVARGHREHHRYGAPARDYIRREDDVNLTLIAVSRNQYRALAEEVLVLREALQPFAPRRHLHAKFQLGCVWCGARAALGMEEEA
jgi:hypothetical protein